MVYNTFDIVFRLSWILALTLYLSGLPCLGSWSRHCSHIWSLRSWNWHHHLIHVEKWLLKMYHTCVFARLAIYGHSDHETDISIEFTSKNGSQKCITLVCLLDLPYMATLITKPTLPLNSHWKCFLKMYHTYVFARLAIYGHSDHETDITIEFMLKNGSQRCITLVCLLDLPYMVTIMMIWTNRHYPLKTHLGCI